MKTVEKALRALTAEMVRMDLNRPLSDCPLEESIVRMEWHQGVVVAKHMDGRPYVESPLTRMSESERFSSRPFVRLENCCTRRG